VTPDRDNTVSWVTDDDGRRWAVERVGRTSGTVSTRKTSTPVAGPADLIRFRCESDPSEPARDATVPAGAVERLSDAELRALLIRSR
jgi:hypothetical protein